MKKIVSLRIGLLFFCFLFSNCNNNKLTQSEIQILADNFQSQIISFAPLVEAQYDGKMIISIINAVAKDVSTNRRIQDSKEKTIKLARDIISDVEFSKLERDSKTFGTFIKLNLEYFEKDKMSLIQEYDFVHKIFQFHYWKNWNCDLSSGFNLTVHSQDTMLLFELKEYHIPIFINNENNLQSPYVLLSNSLQQNDKNKVYIKTGKYQDGVITKEFETTAYNKLTGEELQQTNSISYRIINQKTNMHDLR